MAKEVTLEQVEKLAGQLTAAEQKRLAETMLRLLGTGESPTTKPGRLWRELRGRLPFPMCGEDAQAWVSRTRRESDEQRELQWRRGP